MYDNNISTFICVSECGSLLKAAEKLYLSPNAVKKRIDRLEESVGACLFSRSAKGMALTPAGKSFYFDCKRLEEEINRARERARNISLKETGVIRLGMMDTFSDEFILSDWFDARNKLGNRKISIAFFGTQPENISEMLGNIGKSIDCAVDIADSSLAERYGTAVTEISRAELCFAIPPAHRLFGKEKLTAEDFCGENVIVMKKERMPLWDSFMTGIFHEYRNIKQEYADSCGIKTFNFAETERKIVVAPEYAQTVNPYFRYFPLGKKYTLPFGIYHSENPAESVKKFLEILQNPK